MADRIRVLIADDHAVVRRGLRLFLDLQEDLEVVGEAADGREAVRHVAALEPDVVLMDLVMPGLDGVEATRLIKVERPKTNILVLTSFADDDKLFPALGAGAAGYLMKDVAPEALADAIRDVHRGAPILHPEVARRLMQQATGARREPEGTVTILFTDIEGSTDIVAEMGDEAARALFREHDRLLRRALEEHGGIEVKHIGDGLMTAFSSARRAVACAVAMQRTIAERNAGEPVGRWIRVRMGLNTGEALAEDHDYFGESVILAARVAAEASGEQILTTAVTRALTGANGARFEDRGEHVLKGIREPQRLFEVVWEERG